MVKCDVHAKGQCQRSRSQRSTPNLAVSGLQFEFTYGNEIIHTAGSSIEEVPYCFSRSSVKFQGHTALKIVEFDPNWAFPDSNSSLNSPMAMKCCTKLETAKERCPIVFQGHPSNFKVTRDKTSPILTQIGRFRTIGSFQIPQICLVVFQMTQNKAYRILSYLEIIVSIHVSHIGGYFRIRLFSGILCFVL